MNDLKELRDHLFGAMRMVKSGEMGVAQARTISDIGRTLIDTAKIELQYMEHVEERCDSGFVRIVKTSPEPIGNVRQIGGRSA
jgi:hypothetical protein